MAKVRRIRQLRRRSGLSIRARLTATGTVVVGLVLAVAVLLGNQYLYESLIAESQDVARARAQALATQLEDGGHLLTLVDNDEQDELVQILNADGAVIGATATARGLTSLAGLGVEQVLVQESDGAQRAFILATATMRADATATEMAGGAVLVGRALDGAQQVQTRATIALVGGAAGLLVLIATATWLLVGRALRPVEQMREQADAISHLHLERRLPEPAGNDEIARLSRTLNAMLTRLDRSARNQRRFVSDASHELRTPLAVVRQNADLLLAYPDRVDAAELARNTAAEAERMQDLVDGLLVLTRSDEQRLRSGHDAVDVDDLLLAEGTRMRAAGRVTVDTSGVTAVRVRGDRALLARAVRNLADNAARHATSLVRMSCAVRDGEAVLDVDDDGLGIPPDANERIFDRFVRLDEARGRDSGGSGLGLAIVREVITVHGGRVRASESPDGGARFRVWLPMDV